MRAFPTDRILSCEGWRGPNEDGAMSVRTPQGEGLRIDVWTPARPSLGREHAITVAHQVDQGDLWPQGWYKASVLVRAGQERPQ